MTKADNGETTDDGTSAAAADKGAFADDGTIEGDETAPEILPMAERECDAATNK